MVKYAICDHGIVEANLIPENCLGSPGGCPAGLYHTLFMHDQFTAMGDLRLTYFTEQLRSYDLPVDDLAISIFDHDLAQELKRLEGLEQGSARLRMMVFDEPVELGDGRRTRAISFLRPEVYPRQYTTPFRCAVAARRRLERAADLWEFKRMGREQIDADLAAARERGFDDVLYLDRMGNWCEASYANIVAVFGKRICIVVPDGLCYRGLTCMTIEFLKSELRPFQVHKVPVSMKEIAKADEVFLTSAIRGLQPVTEIEGVGTWPLAPLNSVRQKIYDEMMKRNLI